MPEHPTAEPVFVARHGLYDVYRTGPVPGGTLLLVPAVLDAWPPEIKNAVDRRRRATLIGRCDCGAEQSTPTRAPDGTMHTAMEHEDDCAATDDRLVALFRRYGYGWPPRA